MADYVKSTQEQATAAWINMLNQQRINELMRALETQDISLEQALAELQKLKDFIGDPQHILGSAATKHGEIAENAQVYISNARKLIEGLAKEYSFDGVGRTAPEDYLRNGKPIQSKFYVGPAGNKTFNAIKKHLDDYENFIKNGGKYIIPKDQYENIIEILKKKPSELSRSEATLVKAIHEWEEANNISFTDKVAPSIMKYSDVQQGAINDTIHEEEGSIKRKDEELRKKAYQQSRPSLKEGGTVTAVSAALEGGVAFCSSVAQKRKSGKKLAEFTTDDWKEVGIDTGAGTFKGGIRGAAVYALSNFTATPANVATGLVTAVFGVTAQAKLLREGEISEEEFLINSETLCLDVSISTVSALLGQLAIPFPVLGAIVGNVVGMYLYDIAKAQGMEKEQSLIVGYQAEIAALNKKLDEQYKELLTRLEIDLKRFKSMLELAFDSEVNNAFAASIHFALLNGVAEEKILKRKSEIDAFFLA